MEGSTQSLPTPKKALDESGDEYEDFSRRYRDTLIKVMLKKIKELSLEEARGEQKEIIKELKLIQSQLEPDELFESRQIRDTSISKLELLDQQSYQFWEDFFDTIEK